MPDEIYQHLDLPSEPYVERLARFFDSDWIIRVDGSLLPGRLVEIIPRKRVKRDEITGEPLPLGDDEEEIVIFTVLGYALTGHPSTRHPRAAFPCRS